MVGQLFNETLFSHKQGVVALVKNKFSSVIIIVMALIFFSSCAPIKRHNRLVKKYPFVHTSDTVKIVDTVRIQVPKIQVDTIVNFKDLTDTIEIIRDRLKIKLYKVHDSIFVSGVCDTITVEKILTRKVPVTVYKHTHDRTWLKWIISLLIVLFTLYAIIRKKITEKENE